MTTLGETDGDGEVVGDGDGDAGGDGEGDGDGETEGVGEAEGVGNGVGVEVGVGDGPGVGVGVGVGLATFTCDGADRTFRAVAIISAKPGSIALTRPDWSTTAMPGELVVQLKMTSCSS